ncbi:MAG: ABC transporter substrate-binding protein [Gemmatimonadota bacterium]|jgi:peptide/nickel transport system substrate-binding protein/oligopeptide transport system substrate-binding protein|nr:ABC transporter substrate-binding protein [Gemmatimonadota bacterium]MDP6802298.1 ABC transporter substrate-binding protein [Gemmatimonadota bacterium]
MLHEGLVAFDGGGEIVPSLARAWELSDDGRLYRFHLDPEARASDGSSITSADVIRTFVRLLDPQTASPRAWVLDRVKGAARFHANGGDPPEGLRAPAPDIVEVELAEASAAFLGLLAMPNAVVLPVDGGESGAVSTGPWVLKERVGDSHLSFVPNPYWHGRAPAFRAVTVRILPEDFTRAAEFEVGRLDILEIPPSVSDRWSSSPPGGATIARRVALVVEYVGLNNDDPVLADVRVRRALNHAVNGDLILSTLLGGRGVRATGAVPPGLPGGGTGEAWSYDPARARELLAEAGVSSDWVLEMWQRPSPRVSAILEAVQADLAAVGVRSVIRRRDWNALKASIDRGLAPAFFINWYADYPDAENFLQPLFHSDNVGGGGNRARFRDDGVDRLLAEMDLERDPARRAQRIARADRTVHALAPWIYLWHPVLEVAVSDRVRGFSPRPVPSSERWLDVRPVNSAAGGGG